MSPQKVLESAAVKILQRGVRVEDFGCYGMGPCCMLGMVTDAYVEARYPARYRAYLGRGITWRSDGGAGAMIGIPEAVEEGDFQVILRALDAAVVSYALWVKENEGDMEFDPSLIERDDPGAVVAAFNDCVLAQGSDRSAQMASEIMRDAARAVAV